MSIMLSVKDLLHDPQGTYNFRLETEIPSTEFIGRVSFENVVLDGTYFMKGSCIRVYGDITFKCIMECNRCLKQYSKDMSLFFDEEYSSMAMEEQYRIAPNGTIDLQPLVNDTVFPALPIERLCKEDCKGLCPHCGIDKNFSSCTCEDSDDDNPFAVLKGLAD